MDKPHSSARSSSRLYFSAQFSLAALLLSTCFGAWAAIGIGSGTFVPPPDVKYANGKSVKGNPELVFTVFDPEAKVSYTLDLGLDMDTFFINAQQDAGTQWFKPVDDENWSTFLSLTSRDKLRWVVLSAHIGGLAAGQQRLFTTLTQGHEAKLRDWTNQQFTNGIGDPSYGQFIAQSNQSGTHAIPRNDYTSNGSNVATALDVTAPRAYFGKRSTGTMMDESFNNTASGFTAGNPLGQSSWFYYLTRSGTSQTGKVTVDEFDNLGGDGYWGFTYVDPVASANSPYAGKFLLSYTLEKSGATASTAEGRLRISMTDYLAMSHLSPPRYYAASSTLAAEYAGYRQGSLVVVAGSMVSAVPEPASWGLMGLGLGLLAVRRRHR